MAEAAAVAPTLEKRRVTVELTPAAYETFRSLCESEHRTLSQQLRLLIDDANAEFMAGLEQ